MFWVLLAAATLAAFWQFWKTSAASPAAAAAAAAAASPAAAAAEEDNPRPEAVGEKALRVALVSGYLDLHQLTGCSTVSKSINGRMGQILHQLKEGTRRMCEGNRHIHAGPGSPSLGCVERIWVVGLPGSGASILHAWWRTFLSRSDGGLILVRNGIPFAAIPNDHTVYLNHLSYNVSTGWLLMYGVQFCRASDLFARHPLICMLNINLLKLLSFFSAIETPSELEVELAKKGVKFVGIEEQKDEPYPENPEVCYRGCAIDLLMSIAVGERDPSKLARVSDGIRKLLLAPPGPSKAIFCGYTFMGLSSEMWMDKDGHIYVGDVVIHSIRDDSNNPVLSELMKKTTRMTPEDVEKCFTDDDVEFDSLLKRIAFLTGWPLVDKKME